MLGTLARRGRMGRSGGDRSGRRKVILSGARGAAANGTGNGECDPRALVRRTVCVGTEAERCLARSTAEVMNSLGSLVRVSADNSSNNTQVDKHDVGRPPERAN